MIGRRSLLIQVFLRATPGGEALLRELWQSCEALGMSEPAPGSVRDLPAPHPTADRGSSESVLVLAARGTPRSCERTDQAFAFQSHDAYGCVVALAGDGTEDWASLERRWEEVAPTLHGSPPYPAAVLGEVRLLRGVYEGTAPFDEVAAALAHEPTATGQAVPSRRMRWSRVSESLALWDTSPEPRSATRTLVVVAADATGHLDGDALDGLLDEWSWVSDRPWPSPLTRYLLQSVKLRHLSAVRDRHLPAIHGLRHDVDALIDELIGLHRRVGSPTASVADGSRLIDDLMRAETALGRLQVRQAEGLIGTLTTLQRMRRSAQITAANMAASVPVEPGRRQGEPLDTDHRLGQWLAEQLDDDAYYLEAVRQRADEVGRVAGAVTQQMLQRHQQHLLQVQGAVLGGILMALAAIQSIGYKVPLPGPLGGPAIALASTLALTLPGAVIRWSRPFGRQAPLRRFDLLAVALTGAAAGWLVVSAFFVWVLGSAAAPVWSVSGAVVGAGLTLFTAIAVGRRIHDVQR
ncbi:MULTISPECIES: CATRA conflict system CASPASE/TPR repeat-associated protein [unclassified Streptomyces]|uniref:CATRA conflict system CASPASE/TPR repeat-associated protein n=1 Tax=unclassified Streptomyces TaxID=2593676 RepID=UPI00343167B8